MTINKRPIDVAYDSNVQRWLSQAEEDLKSARVLRVAQIYPASCFLAHQSAEKALKAILVAYGDLVQSHALCDLKSSVEALLTDGRPLPALVGVARLDRYYLGTRCPDALPEGATAQSVFDVQDADEAIGTAGRVVTALARWLREDPDRLGSEGSPGCSSA